MSFQGKKLINDPNAVVTEFIEGLVETYPGLQYLDGFPEVKVVLRADVSSSTYDHVSVISGGGSGHEPAHAGFVGQGMLTAAICGDIFASPPVDSILAGIRAVTGPKGCLLIVKNYTGDRLNFGLAAEQAKSEGYKVEMVIVGDDCALPPRGIAGRRGLAGTIFVHKVAGAAAAAGCSLTEVTAEARRASEMVGTMGVALSVCTLPGQVTSDRLGPGKMELGLGIHGELGAAVADLQPVDVVVAHVLMQILSPETKYVPIERGNNVVLMINGLGATPVIELMVAAGKAVPRLQLEHGLAVDRVYTGSFMTSLDMAGLSITVMKVDEGILQRLDAPTKAPAWPVGLDGNRPPAKIPVPVPQSPLLKCNELSTRPQELSEQGHTLEVAIEAAASELINMRDALNEWDSKVGDGDCGSTMFRGASAILEDMKKYYPLNDVTETVKEIGSSIRRVMGGTSGIIYDILFKAAYAELKSTNQGTVTSKEWVLALQAAIAAVSKYGGASAGYRTLLDALIPASELLQERLNAGDDPVDAFALSSEAAISGAMSTKDMPAQAGRSTYISSDILASVPDPGAMAAASWYKASALAVKKLQRTS
ncbi:putative 3,4-dihydroxy-2-butanone kinase isoform X1 [Chenopodium quinoa]|uniref:putative 3,4-dihydroxy-2-butanone kinase isoform X1 n=1 Tax=Chenopodium quinoa TaxID=63459 RepID=UPI000B79681C|nr:putative 3,4-dihydroxy-2-butanone kinase isoform X1 [Chenopodium quinoa]XP_021724779.1 putative 3,4-dihydroxy-2-butanone kinase isoform X1 [Chenopodium quinoa]